MFDDYANLRPLKGAAEILAQDKDWPVLYDIEQLKKNEVKVTAATYAFSCTKIYCFYHADQMHISYYDDMYVDFGLAQETANTIRNTEQFITNQMYHSALRHHYKEVIEKLFKISKRERD